ncbi:MAG: hypothetical protein KGS48_19245, partial [Bacteroidetes bacterium]|nr:hypothetical protein [Bacteroidota bacterium]
MKQFLTLLLLCWSTALLFSQENSAPPAKKPAPPVPKYVLDGPDPLGRPYHPTVGILPAVATIPMPSDVLNYMGISFVNGMSLNALLPFGAVNKAKFDSMSDILEGLTQEEIKKYYYWESVGVEYLARLEVNQYAMLVDKDTVWDNVVAKQFHMKDVYNGFAHVTVSIFDVSTSNLLFANSFSANGSSRNPPVTPLKYGQPDS